MVDSKMGGDPRAVNARLKLTSQNQLGGTAQLGSTAGTPTVLAGTANIGTTPNVVPSTTTQAIGTVGTVKLANAQAVGESGSRPLQIPGISVQPVEMHKSCSY